MYHHFGTPNSSAHIDHAKAAASRGIKVIIAGAGGSAHLPGMLASCTPLPVTGVPVKASSPDGLDSLLSIVQMPRGVLVATMGIGNSTNAALLAARIIGLSDPVAQKKVQWHMQATDVENMEKKNRLEEEGWKAHTRTDSLHYK